MPPFFYGFFRYIYTWVEELLPSPLLLQWFKNTAPHPHADGVLL